MNYQMHLRDASSLFMTAISQHILLFSLSLLTFFILLTLIFNFFNKTLEEIELNKFYILKKLSLIAIAIFFIRGMFQHIPLNPWQSNQIGDVKLSSLALNGAYNTIFVSIDKKSKLKPIKLPKIENKLIEENMKALYGSSYTPYETNLNKPNVIFFFLESWSGIYLKSYGFNKTTTPFFESILKNSIRPKAMIAGGHRTTEGIFCTLCSFQNPLGNSIAKTKLQDFKYNSIIDIFNKYGYESAFFQGTSKETSGTGSLAQTLGFKNSYGKRDIKKTVYEKNSWGVQDPDLYSFTLKKLKSIKKPFVIGINGATTHDDKLPKGIKTINFVKDEKLNKKLNALHFSDFALKEFVNNILKKYPNTLLVFFADHCGSINGSTFENYLIPFALYHKDLKAKYFNFYISQRDISPTVLDAVFGNYKKKENSMSGKSLFSDNHFFADYYHNGILGWVEDNKALELNLETNKYRCYDISKFTNKEINCTKNILKFKEKSLSFSKISQKSLFEGKTTIFKIPKK